MKSRVSFKGNLIRTSGKAVGDRRLLEKGLKPDCSSVHIILSFCDFFFFFFFFFVLKRQTPSVTSLAGS